MNFISVHIKEATAEHVRVELENGVAFNIPVDGTTVNVGDRMSLGIRPEHLLMSDATEATIEGEVMIVEKLGQETQVYLNLEGADADVIFRQPDTLEVEPGDHYAIGIDLNVVTYSTMTAAHVVVYTKRLVLRFQKRKRKDREIENPRSARVFLWARRCGYRYGLRV